MKLERNSEIASARQRIEELESLAAMWKKEVYISLIFFFLNFKLCRLASLKVEKNYLRLNFFD